MTVWELAQLQRLLKQASLDLLVYHVARHLSGRAVTVKWEQPYIKSVWGLTTRHHDRLLVQVDPSLSDEKKLEVLVHEIAHCKLHGGRIVNSDHAKRAPASWKITDRPAMKRATAGIKSEADELTERWLKFAEARAPDGDLLEKLNTLLDWKDG